MDERSIIDAALSDCGFAIGVLAHPGRGDGAIISYANDPFVRIARRPREVLCGSKLATLGPLFDDRAAWTALVEAIRSATRMDTEVRLSSGGIVNWFSVGVSFQTESMTGLVQAVVVAQDITEARRAALQQSESQRLLAGIFLRVSAAVTIVKDDGSILMANPAYKRLVGYSSGELVGKNVSDLTPSEFAEAANAARANQFNDGKPYAMRLETIAKDGRRIPITLTSVALSDAEQRLRVVTVVPLDHAGVKSPPEGPGPCLPPNNVGDMRVVSLEAFRKAFGSNWERVATRAMLKAEQVIKRRLHPDDVLTRSDEQSFAIWFSSSDEDANAAVLASAVREIRLRFLTEFGEEAAEFVSAAMGVGPETPPGHSPAPPQSPPAIRATRARSERAIWVKNI